MDIPLGRGRTVEDSRHHKGYGSLVRGLREMLAESAAEEDGD
jgi:hypothetical protein